MTVFLALIMLTMLSLAFTMAESVRIRMLSVRADDISLVSAESMYSMYVDKLWDDYGITGLDVTLSGDTAKIAVLEDRMLKRMEENAISDTGKNELDLLRLRPGACAISNVGYLTDNGGAAFIKLAAKKELTAIPGDALDKIKNSTDDAESADKGVDAVSDQLNNGEKALKDPDSFEDDGTEAKSYPEKDWTGVDDPIPSAKKKKKAKSLSLYLPDGSKASDKSADFSKAVSKRRLRKGSSSVNSGDLITRALYGQYVFDNLGTYINPSEGNALSYGAEYILCGKNDDRSNLLGTVRKIMLMREAVNMAAIYADSAKTAEAGSLATALAGASVNPVVVEAVKAGIIAAWAYGESLLDMRTLLSGERVPAVKDSKSWNSALAELPLCFDNKRKAVATKVGLSYEDYLRIFLAVTSQKKLGLRGMDLIEKSLNRNEGYETVKMDNLIYSATIETDMSSGPVFLGITGGSENFMYSKSCRISASYIDGIRIIR